MFASSIQLRRSSRLASKRGRNPSASGQSAVAVKKRRQTKAKEQLPSDRVYDALLFDIEGTTTPISFVHDVLFPYARNNLEIYFERNWGTKETIEVLKKHDSFKARDAASHDGNAFARALFM